MFFGIQIAFMQDSLASDRRVKCQLLLIFSRKQFLLLNLGNYVVVIDFSNVQHSFFSSALSPEV